MALSAPTLQELLRIAREHYPPGLDAHDLAYRDSPQFRALDDVRRRAAQERVGAWTELVRAFIEGYGRERVFDTTHLLLDSCFRVRVYAATKPEEAAVAAVLMVSVLAPVHTTYTVVERGDASSQEMQILVAHLNREAAEKMHSALIDWGTLETPVPWASTMHAALGSATLAALLLSDDRR